jgi:CxxC motif-containing protein
MFLFYYLRCAVMEKINQVVAKTPIKIGDVLLEGIDEDANLVATMNLN